jgi:signal transduction histidine kinase/HAMP domain-containing protein
MAKKLRFWHAIQSLKLRNKLLICFLAVIGINAAAGALNLSVIRQLGELVNMTYDKALMSGTFAQASKYDFVKFDSEIRAALSSTDEVEFKKHSREAAKADETLSDDLQVVEERALSVKSGGYINEIRSYLTEVKAAQKTLLKVKHEALVSKDHSASMTLLAQWAADPTRKQIEEKLTLLYDDAAEVGYHFRLDSEMKNKRNLTITIWVLALSMGLSLLLSAALSFRLLKPLVSLVDACQRIQGGDYSTRARLKSSDEFGSLSHSFDSMLDTIEQKDKDMSSLLSALPFGVFYFDREGTISKQRSKATDTLFPSFSSFAKIESLIQKYKGLPESEVRDTVKIVVDEMLPFASATDLLPAKFTIGVGATARIVNLSYRDQRSTDDKVDRVIVIAEDVTEKTFALRQNEYQTERVKRISVASTDIEGFREFSSEAMALYEGALNSLRAPGIALTSQEKVTEKIKRDLHSLKGLLGVYEFAQCASAVHQIESSLAAPNELDSQPDMLVNLLLSQKEFLRQSFEISEILGLKKNDSLRQYDISKIEGIRRTALQQKNTEIIDLVARLDQFPLSKVLGKYPAYCEKLAEQLGDKMVKVNFAPISSELANEEAQHLDAIFIHLLRNSLDHGIESVEERLEVQKPEAGSIALSCARGSDNSLTFTIEDDGRGIDGNRLSKKAVERGLWTDVVAAKATEEEKIRLIFASGFSTKEEASEISGRGVGMDAVREYLESVGGSINIDTKIGKGTRFILHVPPYEEVRLKKKNFEAAA